MSLERLRQRMIADIEREVEYTSRLIGKHALDSRVMEAMENVPRESFVPGNMTSSLMTGSSTSHS